jgi:hypothetical protein
MSRGNESSNIAIAALGIVWGGLIGFIVRGRMNEAEVIGFGNIPEQIGKLILWSVLGAAIGGLIALAIAGRRME